MQSTSRAEAERLLGIAEKLLQSKDLNGSRDFALLAQETEPLLDGSEQILAVVDVLIASEKQINNQPDWYSVLHLTSRQNDDESIKRQYRRLALLLHPDKNKFPFSDSAFKLVADAWAVLSDPVKKSAYDSKVQAHDSRLSFEKVDLREKENLSQNLKATTPMQRDKIPVRRNPTETTTVNIWTVCPYCYNLYEYAKMYEGCCLRCANCKRAFQAVAIPPASLPPAIPGKEAYYCCWSYFPMGFAMANSETAKTLTIPNWMPPIVPTNAKAWPVADSLPDGSSVPLAEPAPAKTPKPAVQKAPVAVTTPATAPAATAIPMATPTAGATVPRKRGRPRKNPL